nr:unnamed protein product [Callosobruchus chinensis]
MRRTRRHKYLQISVFFLVYSIVHEVSSKETSSTAPPTTLDDVIDAVEKQTDKPQTHEAKYYVLDKAMGHGAVGMPNASASNHEAKHHILGSLLKHSASNVSNKTAASNNETHEAKHHLLGSLIGHGAANVNSSSKNNQTLTKPPLVTTNNTVAPTIASREGREHAIKEIVKQASEAAVGPPEECTPPAIKQFPHPMMSPSTRRHGGLVIHIIVAVYMFLGLAIVCDEYFVASLDRICEELKMSPDVAGATFMAAGSSAPELATVIIGVFFAKDDIGISGVIGSAVFNIMFVIACCGLCSTAAVYLNWWPLVRDCFFYAVSIVVMLIVINDKQVTWLESLLMLIVYLIYCVVLHFNTFLEKWAQTLPVPFKKVIPNEQSGLVSYKTLEDDGNKYPNYGIEKTPEVQDATSVDQGMKNWGMEWSPEKHQENFANELSGPDLNQATIDASPNPPPPPKPQQDYYRPKEYDPAAHKDPLVKPEEGGLYAQFSWGLVFPIHWLCRKTMPDCRSEKYKNWYPFTFFISMVWISFYSYFMVWMITIIGYTLGIPDTVMGLTFVAAGVSVPDALSSIAVVKEGYGDMAVSNAVGSNVFDILVCLGLPWFLKTALSGGTVVKVISKGLAYSTLSLLSTVVFLVVATHYNGWKLDRRFGIILMVWYLIFITFASMYELNVFGKLNPPECITDW